MPDGTVKEDGGAQQEHIVYLKKNGEIYFEGKIRSLQDLVGLLHHRMNGKKGKTVFVQADRSSNYGDVVKIVDALKGINGVSYVALSTQPTTNS